MELPSESLTGLSARDKIVTAEEAVALIRDGDTIVAEGFAGQCFAEELTLALEARFLQTGTPKDLTLVFTVAQGDREGRGFDRLCYEGLLKRAIGGHWGMSGELGKMAVDNKIEGYNLPQGVIAQLFRDTAAGKPGLLTRVGLDTFVDPRNGGGKINDTTTEDRVQLMLIDGAEYLFYKAFERLDVAFLRGTTADPNGNISMEREALFLESLAVATAVHNAGGLVIVQVERIADVGALHPKDVKIPGVLVDCVVVSTPDHHTQTWGTHYSAALSGELRVPLSSIPPLELSVRKVIARRAAMELRPNAVVNLGIGIPEGVAAVAAEEHVLNYIVLTAEPGVIGGLPAVGKDFGSAINGDAILEQPAQFDFYDGGGLDAAFLGMAQADASGNVNVSKFGPRLAGSGGFINISQNARKLVFLGTFLAPARTSGRRRAHRRRRRGCGSQVPRQRRAAHLQRPVRGRSRTAGALRDRTLRLPAHRRRPATHRDRPGRRPGQGCAAPHRVHPHHRRGADTDGRQDLPRRAHRAQGRSAHRAAGGAL
jgi:propionate CoA-transferase